MKELINNRANFFERTIDDVLGNNFFNTFNSNIREVINGYELEVMVPGMNRRDLQLIEKNGVLTIKGERIKKNGPWWRRQIKEFEATQIERTYTLPENAIVNRIKAKCENGILHIFIPKAINKSNVQEIRIKEVDEQVSWRQFLIGKWGEIVEKMSNLNMKLKSARGYIISTYK